MALKLLLWLGMTLLYFGFWGVFGSLLRRARNGSPMVHARLTLGATLILMSATAFVLGVAGIAFGLKLVSLIAGAAVGLVAYRRPSWAPALLWGRPFTRVYLACAMAITALWEASLALSTASLAAPLLAAAAGLAGAASLSASRKGT
jgi:hypothetical protein